MHKSLFKKMFTTIVGTIMVSIIVLGAILLAFSSRYFQQDRYKSLDHNVQQAAALTYTNLKYNGYQAVSSQVVYPRYKMLADAIGADFYLYNMQGELLMYVQGTDSVYSETAPLSESMIATLLNQGTYQGLTKMNGLYTERHYTVGHLITSDDGVPAAVVFASAPKDMLTQFLLEILKMFVVSSLVVIILIFAAAYFLTNGMVRPLREMVLATQSFSKGDFTVRVPVESYDELGQLAIAFNNMATSLASLESVRRSFTANVSHELRTPMTTIAGFIDGILDGTIEEEKRDYYLQIVSEEIKRLSRLVKSMLNIARIEANELQLSPDLFDVNDIVIKTVFSFEPAINGKNLEVRGLDCGHVMVEADPDLVHQVVYNLLENAVKFADEGGYIEVRYRDTETETAVSIRNSGDGISRDELPHVFDRFYKSDKSRSQDRGGAGLGLHIVRSIVNLHGGSIDVQSQEGEYTEFTFSIPKKQKVKKTGRESAGK